MTTGSEITSSQVKTVAHPDGRVDLLIGGRPVVASSSREAMRALALELVRQMDLADASFAALARSRRRHALVASRRLLAVAAVMVSATNAALHVWPIWVGALAAGYLLCSVLALPEMRRRTDR